METTVLYQGLCWGYIGMTEKKMQATIVHRGDILFLLGQRIMAPEHCLEGQGDLLSRLFWL